MLFLLQGSFSKPTRIIATFCQICFLKQNSFHFEAFLVSNNKIARKDILISESAQMFMIIPNNTKKTTFLTQHLISTVFDESPGKDIDYADFASCSAQTIEQKFCWIWLVRCTKQKLLSQYIYSSSNSFIHSLFHSIFFSLHTFRL